MKNYPYVPSMVQAITVLTVLKMMTKAQTSCGSGSMSGKIMYERLPNTQLSGFDDDIVKDTAPPFMVLEKCQDLCLRDRASNNIVRTCSSFDFQPGSRIATYNGGPEYEESTCYLTREQAAPEGIGNLMLVPNSVHFTEVCIRAQKAERECPNRRYIFERHPRKKLKLTSGDIKEVPATNRSECEDKCLSEFSFVCRSASFDSAMRMCMLSSFTRRTRPDLLEDDPNSDYLENTCLNAERRCGGLAIFIKEENKRLGGPFEVDLFNNITLQECQAMCVRAEKYFCRSVEYDEMTKQCTLSEEDSISQKDDLGTSSSLTHHFYDYACLDSPASSEYPDNSVTSHLFSGKHPETAFHRFRNSMLGGDHRTELSGKSLSECLDECLRSPTFQCRSAVYSERYRSCRLSLHNQRDGMRIIYDADYDYYENLMHHGGDTNMNMPGRQPGEEYHPRPRPRPGQYPSSDGYGTYPPSSGGSGYYPPRRYRPSGNGLDSHSDGIYPHDRYYPSSGGSDGNFRERYPIDSYPPSSSGGSGGRYPSRFPSRYPTRPLDEYPDRPRYPILPSDNYPDRPKYPIRPSDEYPDRRFPLRPLDEYPDRKYPGRPLDEYPDRKYPGRPLDEYPDRKYPGRPLDEYPDRKYPGRPLDEYPDRKYPVRPSDEYPNRKYPGRPLDEYPDRKYPARPVDGYPDRKYPARPLDEYPDRKYPVRPLDDYPEKKYPARPVDEYPDRPKYPARPLDEYPDRAKFPARPLDEYPDVTKYPTRPLDEYPDRPKYPTGPVTSRYPLPNRRIPDDRYIYDYDRFGDTYGGQKDRDKYDRPDGFYAQNGDTYNERYDFRNENRYGGHRGNGYGGDRYNKFGGNRYGDNFDDNRDNRYNDRKYSFYGDGQSGGSKWFFRPNRRPGRPLNENVRPISPGPDGPIYDDHGIGPVRPYGSRCDETDNFKQVGVKQRIRKDFIIRFLPAISLLQCQSACVDSKDFTCRSFNYRESPQLYEGDRINCELSDRDSRDLELSNPQFFENAPNFDFYERSNSRQGADGDCLDVSQLCNEDGMEFTLRTTEGFYGRIYAYGHYDQCFFRGNGGTVNVLRISGTQGYPECGTQRYGDTMTNIVVVQFSDFVQTGKDKRFNLTCLFRGPGEAVVSSAFIGAGSGSPIPIEYLPAENTLSSKVRLLILYQGRPTTTIAVGDPLTFKLEAQDGYNYISDIFATNVVARDPYSGRSVQLIDQRGCPVDSYVFPELDRGRSGDTLEAHFNAFKIPESNFLVFEATVRTCREGCQPAYCQSGSGRSEPSFGRRKRDVNETLLIEGNNTVTEENASNDTAVIEEGNDSTTVKNEIEEPEYVREMIEVFESREELQQEARRSVPVPETVCITSTEYQGLISALLALIILLIAVSLVVGLAYRRYWTVMKKNVAADHSSSRVSSFTTTRSSGVSAISIFGTGFQKPFTGFSRARNFPKDDVECPEPAPGGPFEDPSEPIYTDPSLFERSRSLRSISVSPKRRQSQGQQH